MLNILITIVPVFTSTCDTAYISSDHVTCGKQIFINLSPLGINTYLDIFIVEICSSNFFYAKPKVPFLHTNVTLADCFPLFVHLVHCLSWLSKTNNCFALHFIDFERTCWRLYIYIRFLKSKEIRMIKCTGKIVLYEDVHPRFPWENSY